MSKGNRLFGRGKRQDDATDSDGRAVPVNEHDLESVVAMLDGLGWTVHELWSRTADEADGDGCMKFLIQWRNLRHALTLNRPVEFNFYDGAHEWWTDIRYIFRDGSAFNASETERTYEGYEAGKNSYEDFLAAYDPGEDPYAPHAGEP